MPKIVMGGHAPLSYPTFDRFRMKAPEDGSSARAIEKAFSCLKWSSSGLALELGR
jgi:hypothetical protein